MSLTTRDGLIAALAATGAPIPFYKTSKTTVSGAPYALFRVAGNPTGGANPSTSGAAVSRSTQGALNIPAPSNTSYLVGASVGNTLDHIYMLYDRLVETGGLSGTVTTAQTVNSASLPARNTSGAGTELWFEVYTALGSTPQTATASYTNSVGTSGRTATLIGSTFASMAANTCQMFTLQSGDAGVQSVQSVTLAGSTGTAGNFGIVIRQQIAILAPEGPGGVTASYPKLGLAVVPDSACLEWVLLPTGTSSGIIIGNIRVAQA